MCERQKEKALRVQYKRKKCTFWLWCGTLYVAVLELPIIKNDRKEVLIRKRLKGKELGVGISKEE